MSKLLWPVRISQWGYYDVRIKLHVYAVVCDIPYRYDFSILIPVGWKVVLLVVPGCIIIRLFRNYNVDLQVVVNNVDVTSCLFFHPYSAN